MQAPLNCEPHKKSSNNFYWLILCTKVQHIHCVVHIWDQQTNKQACMHVRTYARTHAHTHTHTHTYNPCRNFTPTAPHCRASISFTLNHLASPILHTEMHTNRMLLGEKFFQDFIARFKRII